jgi:hypothetical protein
VNPSGATIEAWTNDMLPKRAEFSVLSIANKATLAIGVLLICLSLVAGLTFVSVSVLSIIAAHISHHWKECFLLSSVSLGGWMIYYTGKLRFGGGLMVFRNNVLLVWFLILTVFISAILTFTGDTIYIVLLVIALCLAAFYVAGGRFLTALWLIRGKPPASHQTYGSDE